jgi:hypothetical protein
MNESEKPKVPIQQHRSSGDTGVPQHGADMNDDPRQAVESGEPDETNRSRGHILDESDKPLGDVPQKGQDGKDEHWESGRHNAQ